MLCHVPGSIRCLAASTEWIVGRNTVHGGECPLQFELQNEPGAPGEGTIRPQGSFPRTPNLLPLSVPELRKGTKPENRIDAPRVSGIGGDQRSAFSFEVANESRIGGEAHCNGMKRYLVGA